MARVAYAHPPLSQIQYNFTKTTFPEVTQKAALTSLYK